MTPRRAETIAALGFTLALSPLSAHAHLVETGLGPVYDGIAHFALTFEDLLPAVALAIFAGLRGTDHARRVAWVLPLAWLLGGLAGIAARSAMPQMFGGVPPLGWLPMLLLGGLVAADLKVSMAVTTTVAAVLGLFLGLANGVAMAQAGAGTRGVLGIVSALFVVTALAAACAAAWQSGWQRIAWRVVGSWIAASGLLLLGWSLR
jgi:hydrogenase/urease accessory protein HupE